MKLTKRVTPDPTGLIVTVELLHHGRPVTTTTCGPEDDTDDVADRLKRAYRHEKQKD